MELAALFTVLWRRRLIVALGLVPTIALGVLSLGGPTTRTGVASMRVALDTKTSETLDTLPPGLPSLETRTLVLADLMGARENAALIARHMRIAPNRLAVTSASNATPPVAGQLVQAALDVAATTPEPYHVSIQAAYGLPIIRIDTSAATAGGAGRLARAAADAMRDVAAAKGHTPDTLNARVEDVGPPHTRLLIDRPSKKRALVVPVLAFSMWCLIVALTSIRLDRRRLRRRLAVDSALPAPLST